VRVHRLMDPILQTNVTKLFQPNPSQRHLVTTAPPLHEPALTPPKPFTKLQSHHSHPPHAPPHPVTPTQSSVARIGFSLAGGAKVLLLIRSGGEKLRRRV
jgi:hypothetical protein